MPFSFPPVSAADRALAAADVPMIIAQAIPTSPTLVKWVDGTQMAGVGDITTWTDRVVATKPSSRAYDGKPHYPTYPAGAFNDWSLMFQFSTAGITFDTILIAGHNFDDIAGKVVDFYIDNAADFNTEVRIGNGLIPRGDGKRIADIELSIAVDTALRYTDVVYGRLSITNGGGANFIPEVGELILGRRRQLLKQVMLPHDDFPMFNTVSGFDSHDGVISHSVRRTRESDLIGKLLLSESFGVADLRAFYRQIGSSFAWLWEPNSNVNDFNMYMMDPDFEFRIPHTGHSHRILQIIAREQGPERFYLDVETR